MNRFCASLLLVFTPAAPAMPPEPMPIATSIGMRGAADAKYMDHVDGLARLAWQATRCPDDQGRLAAVEQMARCCVHPRRADTVLASIETKDPNPAIRQAACRIRVQLRLETTNMIWVDQERESGEGRSVVAHDPIPYREALAGIRTTPTDPMTACPDCMPAVAVAPLQAVPVNSAQQHWADNLAAARTANAQNLPKRAVR